MIIIVFAGVAVVAAGLGWLGWTKFSYSPFVNGVAPLRVVTLKLTPGTETELFATLAVYARRNSLEFTLDNLQHGFTLIRDDVGLIGLSINSPTQFDIVFAEMKAHVIDPDALERLVS